MWGLIKNMDAKALRAFSLKIGISLFLLSIIFYFISRVFSIPILYVIKEIIDIIFYLFICTSAIFYLDKKRSGAFWADFKYFGLIFLFILGIFVYIFTRSFWWR
jgi:hypothetical protein